VPQLSGAMLGRMRGRKLDNLATIATLKKEGVVATYGSKETAARFITQVRRKRNGCGHQFDGFGGKMASRRRIYLTKKN
jgi:hypothetical protein